MKSQDIFAMIIGVIQHEVEIAVSAHGEVDRLFQEAYRLKFGY